MKFSVIIPVYNKASSIRSTLQSVFDQTYKNVEIILVDDGSTDNLYDVLNDITHRVVIIRQANSGVAEARNSGIRKSSGDYICFLDADDIWKPNHLQILNQALQKYPNVKFLSTMYLSTFANGEIRSKMPMLKKYEYYSWIEDYFKVVLDKSSTIIHTDTVCIQKSILDTMQFASGERIGEDTDLWYRIAAYYPLLLIKEETAVYHRENSTATLQGNNNLDWAFARRERELMVDASISLHKRKNIQLLIDRWKCTCCRELISKGDLRKAKNYLRQTHYFFQKRVIYCWVLYIKASLIKIIRR